MDVCKPEEQGNGLAPVITRIFFSCSGLAWPLALLTLIGWLSGWFSGGEHMLSVVVVVAAAGPLGFLVCVDSPLLHPVVVAFSFLSAICRYCLVCRCPWC